MELSDLISGYTTCKELRTCYENYVFLRVQTIHVLGDVSRCYSWHEINNSFPLFDVMMWFSRAASIHILFITTLPTLLDPRLLHFPCNLIPFSPKFSERFTFDSSRMSHSTDSICSIKQRSELHLFYFRSTNVLLATIKKTYRDTYIDATVGRMQHFSLFNLNLESNAREKCDVTYITSTSAGCFIKQFCLPRFWIAAHARKSQRL